MSSHCWVTAVYMSHFLLVLWAYVVSTGDMCREQKQRYYDGICPHWWEKCLGKKGILCMKSELYQHWRITFTGKFEDQGAPLAVKPEQFYSGWYSRAGMCRLWPVRSHFPSMEMSSPSLHWRQKGHRSRQETMKVQGQPGWRQVLPCSLMCECAVPTAHAPELRQWL